MRTEKSLNPNVRLQNSSGRVRSSSFSRRLNALPVNQSEDPSGSARNTRKSRQSAINSRLSARR